MKKNITMAYLIAAFLNHNTWLSKFIPDKQYLEILFKGYMGTCLDLENPITFNEKLNWLKLYDRNPTYTEMVDKYEAKKFISKKIGDSYIVPTLGIYNSFDEIKFDQMPCEFVIKCTHDSGSVYICTDKNKFDYNKARKNINKSLQKNFFYGGREWPYKNIKPRIIVEEYLSTTSETGIEDYKFFCFNGEAKAMFIASERQNPNAETKFDFYDMEFNHLPFTNGHPNSALKHDKPKMFLTMKEIAEKLSAGIPQLRVDFYCINNRIYVGELTFYHWSGLVPFVPCEWDKRFGDWIDLNLYKN